jgi:hypothetical protein
VSEFVYGVIVGLVAGGPIGVLVTALCVAARNGDAQRGPTDGGPF